METKTTVEIIGGNDHNRGNGRSRGDGNHALPVRTISYVTVAISRPHCLKIWGAYKPEMPMAVGCLVSIFFLKTNLTRVRLCPLSIAIDRRVRCRSYDMEVPNDDARDDRTVLGEHHCGTHVHRGLEMAELAAVTHVPLSRTCVTVNNT